MSTAQQLGGMPSLPKTTLTEAQIAALALCGLLALRRGQTHQCYPFDR
jgi:hypothetical protein